MKIVNKSACVLVTVLAGVLGLFSPAFAQEVLPPNPVVATVNDKTILLSDVEDARNLLPVQFQGAPLKNVYPMLVETLINSRIAADMAQNLGFDKTPEYGRRMERVSDQVLERILLTRHLQQKVTDVLVQERYLQMVERKESQNEVHARHILVKSEDLAKTIIEKLDDGDDFVKLAQEFSKGPSAQSGGDLGWFGPGRMVPQFDNAVRGLSVDSYTHRPVLTQFGWHIIFLEERRPLPIPTLEQAKPGLVNSLSAELGQKLMVELRKNATIEVTPFSDVKKKDK